MKVSKEIKIKGLELEISELEEILNNKIDKIFVLKLEMGAIEDLLVKLKKELITAKR